MTKLKTKKKLNESTIAIIIMAVVMVAMLAFGGTYAYFTAQSAVKTSNFHVGKVALKSTGTFKSYTNQNVVPGDTVLEGSVTYINESNVSTYIAVVFDILYKGGYYVYDGTKWTRKDTGTEYKNLTNYQINEAFGNVLSISEGGIIDGDYWVQGGEGNENIYMMRATKDAESLIVAAQIDAQGAMKDEGDRTTTFVEATEDKPVKISKTTLKRHYKENDETGAVEMIIPAEDYLGHAWDASTNNIYLEWENADITIQFTAYQIQSAHIQNSNDDVNEDSFATNADIDTVWATMKTLVGYNDVQNFITA